MSMFQHLDDPLPLHALRDEQREAVIRRGEALRRRRRVRVIGVPLAAVAVAASAAVALAVVPGPSADESLVPAVTVPPDLVLPGPDMYGRPANYECLADLDSASGSGPDVAFFSVDRAGSSPLFHYALAAGEVPTTGLVEFRIEATNAGGEGLRELVWRIVDGKVVEQYVRDPRTGARLDVQRTGMPFGGPGDRGVGGATFPEGSLSGLGDGWRWVGSLRVNGLLVDACGAGRGQN